MSSRIFAEDEVVLREDSSICAIVEQTWQDGDITLLFEADFIPHRKVTWAIIDQCTKSRSLAKGLVIIKFVEPPVGLAIVHEDDLLVRDRGLCVGDVVKRHGSSPESGYVVKTSLECDCRPVYPSILYSGTERWPHKAEDKEIRVPSEDLELLGFVEGKFVIYKDWIGEIIDMTEEVTVRMSDGSVVRIGNLDDLEVYPAERPVDLATAADQTQTLANAVKSLHQAWKERPQTMHREAPDHVYPGQLVYAKKSVFRLGSWIIGSYTPAIPASGHIMEVHITSVEVDWLTCNPFDNEHSDSRPQRPDAIIDGHELNEMLIYNRNNLTELTSSGRNFGARQSQDIVVGDPVAFRDVAGAAVKHAKSGINKNAGGGFKRVPRSITNGFDVNALKVIGTTQHVIVQWQDGAITQERSTDLIPHLLPDEHDYFVGELCSLKSAEKMSSGIVILEKVGVVQSMDARERTVKVRWYANSRIEMLEGLTSELLLPQSMLSGLCEEAEEISVYELSRYEAITKRRGDLVLVIPSATDPPASNGSDGGIRWFGEVVDLGKDGIVTVRLGALDKVEDIKVEATNVFTILGADDQTGIEDGASFSMDDDDSMMDSDYSTDAMEVLEEIITYEGEPPEDPGDEDAWMTDASDEISDDETNNEPDEPTKAKADGEPPVAGIEDQKTENGEAGATNSKGSSANDRRDYSFVDFTDKPAQFEILDGAPPPNHHFRNSPSALTGPLLRRIRKEHKMLASLPPGIFVRTWSDALYLMRILILGPRATPYELAPFVLDVHFRDDYPTTPPQVHFHSWTYGVGRVNPNLYEDGMVCLSILGTWHHDQRNEGWNKDHSSLLQVLVSLMGLVLVESPYYNEAGFEVLVGTEETAFASETYSQRAFCMSKGFVEYALQNHVAGLEDILKWLYVSPQGPRLLVQVVADSRYVLDRSQKRKDGQGSDGSEQEESNGAAPPVSPYAAKVRLTAGAQGLLRRHLDPLEKRLGDLG